MRGDLRTPEAAKEPPTHQHAKPSTGSNSPRTAVARGNAGVSGLLCVVSFASLRGFGGVFAGGKGARLSAPRVRGPCPISQSGSRSALEKHLFLYVVDGFLVPAPTAQELSPAAGGKEQVFGHVQVGSPGAWRRRLSAALCPAGTKCSDGRAAPLFRGEAQPIGTPAAWG